MLMKYKIRTNFTAVILALSLSFAPCLAADGDGKEKDKQHEWKIVALVSIAAVLTAFGGYKIIKHLKGRAVDSGGVPGGNEVAEKISAELVSRKIMSGEVDVEDLKLYFAEEQADNIAKWFADKPETGQSVRLTEIMEVATGNGRLDIMDRAVELANEQGFQLTSWDLKNMLTAAAGNNHIKAMDRVVKLANKHGTNINIWESSEALIAAIRNNHIEAMDRVVELANKQGFQLKSWLTSWDLKNMLTAAAGNNHIKAMDRVVKLANEQGFQLESWDFMNMLTVAAGNNHIEAMDNVVKLANEHGTNISIWESSEALIAAIRNNHIEAINYLVKLHGKNNNLKYRDNHFFLFGETLIKVIKADDSTTTVPYVVKLASQNGVSAAEVFSHALLSPNTSSTEMIKLASQNGVSAAEVFGHALLISPNTSSTEVIKLASQNGVSEAELLDMAMKTLTEKRFSSYAPISPDSCALNILDLALRHGVRVDTKFFVAKLDALSEGGRVPDVIFLLDELDERGIDLGAEVIGRVIRRVAEAEPHDELASFIWATEFLIEGGKLSKYYDRYFGAGAFVRDISDLHGFSRGGATRSYDGAPYEVLGISEDASFEDIKNAFRKLIKKHHPDKNPGDEEAEEKAKKLIEAFRYLEDKTKQ